MARSLQLEDIGGKKHSFDVRLGKETLAKSPGFRGKKVGGPRKGVREPEIAPVHLQRARDIC